MCRKAVFLSCLLGFHPCLDYYFGLLVAGFLNRLLDFASGWTPMLLLLLHLLGRFVAVPVGGG